MASPSLKIKLRLTKPKLSESPQSPQSPASPISIKTTVKEDDSTTSSPRKKPKTVHRSRKPKSESTPGPETPATVDDDNNSTVADEAISNRRGGNQGNSNSNSNTSTLNGKDILKYKDVKARRWVNKPLVFCNLDGSQVQVGSWQSDEKMTINHKTTEPVTVAEIDQLFSSAGGEKDFRPFLCTQPGCSKSFTTFDQLQTHETNMHGTKKMVCGIEGCHKSFVTTGQLTKHRKMVHFRAARKAKLEAAAAAAAAGTSEETSLAATPAGDDESVDVGNSESNL